MTVLSGQPISIEETAQRCAVSLVDSVPVVVVTGHYGVGKTNFSLNLALDAAAAGREVTLIDLDVVNPYFRSSEYREMMEAAGIRLIAPVFAERGSNLDVPSLTGAIVPAIQMAQHAWEARLSEGSEAGRRRSPSEFRSDENSPVDCSPKRGLSERLSIAPAFAHAPRIVTVSPAGAPFLPQAPRST